MTTQFYINQAENLLGGNFKDGGAKKVLPIGISETYYPLILLFLIENGRVNSLTSFVRKAYN